MQPRVPFLLSFPISSPHHLSRRLYATAPLPPQDMTGWRLAESARLWATEELQAFIDTANAPIIGIDAAGLINVCNPRASAVMGYSFSEIAHHDPCEVPCGGVHGVKVVRGCEEGRWEAGEMKGRDQGRI
jgi:PAS domain-containing protein